MLGEQCTASHVKENYYYMWEAAWCFFSIHLATPSASLVLVISSAAQRTSSGEFSTATPMPA